MGIQFRRIGGLAYGAATYEAGVARRRDPSCRAIEAISRSQGFQAALAIGLQEKRFQRLMPRPRVEWLEVVLSVYEPSIVRGIVECFAPRTPGAWAFASG